MTKSNEIDKKCKKLINNFDKYLKEFNKNQSDKGPDLYFYKKTIFKSKNSKKLDNLLKKNSQFLELIYATLVAWGMNSRSAKMVYFDNFQKNILDNKRKFIKLSEYELHKIKESDLTEVKNKLKDLFLGLNMMYSKGRIVSNSKLMHFILPKLVMPIDGKYTLTFFYNNTGESKDKFLEIFEFSWQIANKLDLNKYVDSEWNQTIPKIIDNAIMGIVQKEKKEKKRF